MRIFRKTKEMCQWNHAREGSSMITVVIGVAFLLSIGLIILSVSTKYVTSVYVDRNSTDNFYQTEGILEEVKTGLLQYASQSADEAYRYILNHYLDATTENKKTQFSKMYIELLKKRLNNENVVSPDTDDETFGKYFTVNLSPDGSDLASAQQRFFDKFDENNVVDSDAIVTYLGDDDEKLKAVTTLSTKPDAVSRQDTSHGYGYVIRKDSERGYSLTLKNLLISYTDAGDYHSTIETDIVIRVPDFKFEGDSTLDQLKNYVSISDDILMIGSVGNEETASKITGNVYAGVTSDSLHEDQGIRICQDSSVKFNSQKIISRGSFDVQPGAFVDITGESGVSDLWLNNIRLTYDGGNAESMKDATSLSIHANSYIANDLDISTDNTTVSLTGKYYGYSYSRNNSTSDEQNPDYSSAILINGKNTTLKAENKEGAVRSLDKLILAGHTFVSKGKEDKDSSVLMGESLAVKSDQLAYLVPDEYIRINSALASSSANLEGHNPVAKTEKEKEKVSIDVDGLKSSTVNGVTLGSLLNESKPYLENHSQTGGYVFYYLNFKDAVSANKYFRNFYSDTSGVDEDGNSYTNQQQMAERSKVYISGENCDGLKIDPAFYLIAGNIVKNYSSVNETLESNYFDASGSPGSQMLQDGIKQGCQYVGLQKTLLESGSTGSMRMSDADKNSKLVAHRIVDGSVLSNVAGSLGLDADGIARIDVPAKYSAGETGVKIQMVPGRSSEKTVTAIENGLVIAGENVTVNVPANFKGLILSCGKVSVGLTPVKMNADMVMVEQIFEYIKTRSDLSGIFYGLNGTLSDNPTDISECVSYENWKKNEL